MARWWRPPWPGRSTSLHSTHSLAVPACRQVSSAPLFSLNPAAAAAGGFSGSVRGTAGSTSFATPLTGSHSRYVASSRYARNLSPPLGGASDRRPAKSFSPPAYWLYGEAITATASTSARPGHSSGFSCSSLLSSSTRLTSTHLSSSPAPQPLARSAGFSSDGTSVATGGLSADGYGHSVTAMARTSSGSGRASPLALYTAEATTLGSLSRSATSSAPLSSAQLSSAPGRASLSLPPAPICCEAAGTYKAAATIEPASPGRLSSPVLLCNGAGRALGRGCSSAHGTCVDQPASISSTASQARRSSNETSDPASHSQARTVTLRYCNSFLRSSSTVMLCSHYRLSRLQPPLLCVRATTAVVVTRSCLRCNLQ